MFGRNLRRPFGFKPNFFLALAFAIPFFLMLLAFVVQRVHPFGTRMILTVDLYHQYAPFLAELRYKLLHFDSLFFSWNIGLGTNFWAIFANYSASPLNLLLLPVPQRFLSDGIAFLACLRIGLSGLFFAMLLRDLDQKREDIFLSLFGAMYALCGWSLAYFWNIMWADAVLLLPLIILGLRRLLIDRKPLLYCISLFLCVWSNYYAAYFVCLFLVLYAPVCYFTIYKRPTWQSFWSSFWRFGLYSALSAGMAAILVYPTWISLQNASATGDSFPKDMSLTHDMFDFFSRFFLASKPNIRDGMANVYSGVIILLLIPLFFLCTKIKLREKIAYGLLFLIMYFSFANRLLNFIWHGFHFPNQIPYRQAFIMSFIVLIMAYKVLRNLKAFSPLEIGLVASLVILYIILYEKIGEGTEKTLAIFLSGAFILLYIIALRLVARMGATPLIQQRFLAGIIAVELVVAVQAGVGMVAMNESFTGWEFFGKKHSEVSAFISEREASGESDGFIRAEMYPAFISNETALYHVKGMSVFSSTASESFVVFMKSLGFHNNGINGVRNYGLTKVTASLLGIRYFIDVNGDAPVPTGFNELEDKDPLRIARNEDSLSLGYVVPQSILNYQAQKKNNPFITTNEFIGAMELPYVYQPQELQMKEGQNLVAAGGNSDNGYQFTVTEKEKSASLTLEPQNGLAGSHMFLYVQSKEAPKVTFNTADLGTIVEDNTLLEGATRSETTNMSQESAVGSSSSQETRTEQIIDLGTYSPDKDQRITLNWSKLSSEKITVISYYIDETTYRQMIDTLSMSSLKITDYSSTHLDGTVDANRDGLLFLTIPYDTGWSATLDGKEVELKNIDKAFMGIEVKQGNHEIHLEYRPEGIRLGLWISLGCLLALSAVIALPKVMKRPKHPSGLSATEHFPPPQEDMPEQAETTAKTTISDAKVVEDEHLTKDETDVGSKATD